MDHSCYAVCPKLIFMLQCTIRNISIKCTRLPEICSDSKIPVVQTAKHSDIESLRLWVWFLMSAWIDNVNCTLSALIELDFNWNYLLNDLN